MKYTELREEHTYVLDDSKFANYIFKGFGQVQYIVIAQRMLSRGTIHAAKNSTFISSNYRLATPQEKEHLQQCIQAGKYVDYKPQNKLVYGYQIL